jgi:hypothetical protein
VSESVFQTIVEYYEKHPSQFVELNASDHSVVFSNVWLPLQAYIRVAEDTEACYSAPHGVFYFSNEQLCNVALTKDQFVQLFNDELSCECDEQGFTHVSEFPENVDDSAFAVSYATKYIQKQMNPSHVKHDQKRSVTWMVCLRSVGCRMFTMSKTWNAWYNDLHSVFEVKQDRLLHPHGGGDPCGRLDIGLNNIKNNSNDSANLCYYFRGDFHDMNYFMKFFQKFLTFGDPPNRDVREYVGFSRD